MEQRIILVSDFSMAGSGYRSISSNLCSGLKSNLISISAIGLGYRGEPQDFSFPLYPCENQNDAMAMLINLWRLKRIDVVIVALDIPVQLAFMNALVRERDEGLKFISITALENPPLLTKWAMGLAGADKVLFISERGEMAAREKGLENVGHLTVGIDTKEWFPLSAQNKMELRKTMGFSEDEAVIITVADNQERKNLWAGFEILHNVKKITHDGLKFKWILVTRGNFWAGYDLSDFAEEYGLNEEYVLYERGMPAKDLRMLYQMADAFLLVSKGEGLNVPVLEAMACGIPVVSTDTGAVPELIRGCGWLVPPEYSFRDVWGNSTRDMIDRKLGAEMLLDALANDGTVAEKALERVTVSRQPHVMVDELIASLKEVLSEK
jgi:glycosyltransferase involved in cell wall biosynthesis